MARSVKHLSSPFATGGGGPRFEIEVQACLVALMLAGGFAPGLPGQPIQKIKFQGRHADFETDDLIIFAGKSDGTEERRLLCQIKCAIALTAGNKDFGDVIKSAWRDFNNPRVFTKQRDAIALITGPLSKADITDVRELLEWARSQESSHEFLTNVDRLLFSNDKKRATLKAFRAHLDAANDSPVSDNELVSFLRHFHLLGFDLDVRSGVVHALVQSLIGYHVPDGAADVYDNIVREMMASNQSAGTVTRSSFPEIAAKFTKPALTTIPEDISRTIAPPAAISWEDPKFGAALAIASLLGAWHERSEADRAIIERMTNGRYDEWLLLLRTVLQVPDSPLSFQNGAWKIKDRVVLWRAVGPRVFDDNLKALRHCACVVLKERDPQFSVDKNRRFAAELTAGALKHSSQMRNGIAETLALLGSHPEPLVHCSTDAPAATATLVVREILAETDWVVWGSVNDVLPLLAEAAPSELLKAIERALLSTPCPFDELFAQEGQAIAGRNYMTGLLWALESLAWEEQYLVPVTVALGKLAERDPGGPWANRPGNSLATIFLPWLPQTTANIDKRKIAVQTLLREAPLSGWKLLLQLLPSIHSVSSGSSKPRWRRSIPEDWDGRPTRGEYRKHVIIYADLAFEAALDDTSRMNELVERLDRLPKATFERVLDHLSSAVVTDASDESRFEKWRVLSDVVRKHRRFAEADWAMPAEAVARIELVASALFPHDPRQRHRVLFSARNSDLFEEKGNWREQEAALHARRIDAIRDILALGGNDAVIGFAAQVESPWYVGVSLGMADDPNSDRRILPQMLDVNDDGMRQFVAGFVRGRFRQGEWSWVDSIDLTSWSKASIARFLAILPFSSATWERADDLLKSDVGEYWRNVGVNAYQAEGNIYLAIDKLLDFGRPRAAIDCLARIIDDKATLDKDRAIRALLAGVASNDPVDSLQTYHLTSIIQALQADPTTDKVQLINVEWAYLPILGEHSDASPRTLELSLATEPESFCEIIRILYRAKNGAQSSEPTEIQRAMARSAYELLHNWRIPPGTLLGGVFSGQALHQWIEAVKRSTEASGHLEVALHQAGGVLIHCQSDPDGLWIHRSAAEVLNREDMEELRVGYKIGVYNSRGAHWVDPSGTPERELANSYRIKADAIENAGFHRFAGALRAIAEEYDRDAARVIASFGDERE